ncbi:2-phospho-L-lactate guanylyltransferase [Halapricum hydrolyticum]|uniref:2-phospho-L-lactate guanylyltransferase n=1 Tax=Halapricum hydrolyticum TaxID=2979991 RepID=A0AAE3IBA4_9EURY|nr:2-phospho-L-lactate guanylyltransferase [Halapricum hydrolyticum]MCU4717777.1 2-phospho-L-lactate guanylyltransferase [Halapricum hydrolyticum]MCU4726941.1 2-phospho-L-lactate guanylyltransferase [Halapricum hydrolyticum]
MHVVVPFDAREPKTRLSPVLDSNERREFARVMLETVCTAIAKTGHEPTVLSTADLDAEWPVRVDDQPLSDAVNAVLADRDGAVAVVMADLALATPEALDRVFEADGEVVFVAGRGGGTNVVLARHPDFRVDYHGVSIRDHRERAADIGTETTAIDSFRLATDVDEPTDLVEVLLHGEGETAGWLRDHAVSVTVSGGRATVERSE